MTKSFVACLAAVLLILAVPASAADLVVVDSSTPGIKLGQIVAEGATLDVPAGATVILVSQSGKTLTLNGPFSGVPEAAGGGGGQDQDLVASLSKLLGGGTESGGLGVMRAVKTTEPTDPWVIVVTRTGTHCAAAGGTTRFWRSSISKATSLSLRLMPNGGKAEVDWPAGAETLAWPAGVEMKDGASYLVRLKNRSSAAKLSLHLIPDDLPTDAHKAARMADLGCTKQAKKLLAGLY